MAWKTFSLPKVPSPLTTAVNGLKSAASAASTALTLVKGIVQAASALSTASLSASQTTIQTAVSTIESAVKSLTNDTGVYVLLVPPRNQVIIPDGVKAALASTFPFTVTPEGVNLQASFNGTETPAESELLRGLPTATGGNAGFVKSVVESFDDLGDNSRPILMNADAVAGIYIVAGASNIANLAPFTNGMSSLLAPGRPSALDSPEIPTPQNLSAKVVSGSAIHLQWTSQLPLVEIPVLATFAKVTEVAIIQSTSIKLISASTPSELFGTNILTSGMEENDAKVISVTSYTGTDLKSAFLDETTHVPGTAYYYAVSFRVTLGTAIELAGDGGTDLGYTRLSNVVKTHLSKEAQGTPRSVAGVPPDWFRTPRTIDLFPALGNLVNQVASLTIQLGDTTTGYSDLLKAGVKAIEQQLKGYTDLATKLTAATSAISAFSSINLGTVSSRTFSGTGGVNFIKKDIVTAFGDTADPARPPFDDDEFVSGVVILSTTPSATALLETLLGSISAGADSIVAALAQIDVQLAAVETAVFGDNMAPGPAPVVPVPSIPVINDAEYCYQSFVPDVVFSDTMQPT